MYITPDWPAPKHISAYTTLRKEGFSLPPFDHFNLANHVGDTSLHVEQNRSLLKKQIGLPSEPIWLEQIHSTHVIDADFENAGCEADASFTQKKDRVCVVLTADCLPILICNQEGTMVAAIHAGWRGLVNGIIEATLTTLNLPASQILCWLGPAIGPEKFEVGDEVREQFLSVCSTDSTAFIPSSNKRWLANLYALARFRLQRMEVTHIYGGQFCTFSDPTRFYSYRRDGNKTGRMATLIWISGNI